MTPPEPPRQKAGVRENLLPHARAILLEILPLRTHHDPLVVAVDGHSGAGKSTLARLLAEEDRSIDVVHGDLFYKPAAARPWPPKGDEPAGHEFELARLEREVLHPLRDGGGGEYTPRDFGSGALMDPVPLPASDVVVVEGVYVMVEALRRHYHYSVWVECPLDICLRRVVARGRGTDEPAKFRQVWFPQENRYIEEHQPIESADLVVNTAENR